VPPRKAALRDARIVIVRARWTAVLALLVSASCGEAEPLTRAEFVRAAEAICRDVADKWAELRPPAVQDPVSEDEYVELMAWDLATGRDLGGEVLARVGDLHPPPALEGRVEEMLGLLEEVVDGLDAIAAAVEIRNEAELERLDESFDDDITEKLRRAAEGLGLPACAKGHYLSSWRAGGK
jgi:hypothetical protein